MSTPRRIEHNIIRLVWDNSNRSFVFSYFVDDFAFKAYSCSYKLFIDAIEENPEKGPIQLHVSTNDEGVNVKDVINISDYRGRVTFPDYEFDENHDSKCIRIQKASETPWVHDKIFWIGRVYPHHIVRNKLISLKSDRFEFMNSDGTNFVSHEDHCKYRYLLDVEGGPSTNAPTGYSLRVKYLMHSGRLLFMVERPLWSWAEMLMEPWVHYVPVKRDLSDLEEKIRWADTHSEDVSQMIERTKNIAPMRKDAVQQVRNIIKENT